MPAKLLPDFRLIPPLSPSDDDPVVRRISPLELLLEVPISILPLLAVSPAVLPVTKVIDPPVLETELPATILTDPPTPRSLEPAVSAMFPVSPSIACPASTEICPLPCPVFFPLWNNIEPDFPTALVPVSMTISPP